MLTVSKEYLVVPFVSISEKLSSRSASVGCPIDPSIVVITESQIPMRLLSTLVMMTHRVTFADWVEDEL